MHVDSYAQSHKIVKYKPHINNKNGAMLAEYRDGEDETTIEVSTYTQISQGAKLTATSMSLVMVLQPVKVEEK